jgi:hypothetical protein
VREVDDGFGVELSRQTRHEKRHAGLAVGIDDALDGLLARAHNLRQPGEPSRSANATVVGPFDGERFEGAICSRAVGVVRERGEDLVRVAGQRFRHAAGRLIVAEIDGLAVRVIQRPGVPGAHQRVLEHRELVGVVADIVQHVLDEARRNSRSADAHRLFDRIAPLVARQARDQILAPVDGFGETRDLRAVAQVVRTHGDRDVDAAILRLRGREQQVDEGGCRLLRVNALLAEAEELLELVDDDEQVGLGVESRRLP